VAHNQLWKQSVYPIISILVEIEAIEKMIPSESNFKPYEGIDAIPVGRSLLVQTKVFANTSLKDSARRNTSLREKAIALMLYPGTVRLAALDFSQERFDISKV
jgi:hypothetical protein